MFNIAFSIIVSAVKVKKLKSLHGAFSTIRPRGPIVNFPSEGRHTEDFSDARKI
jgi:hypothetical protein